MKKYTIILALFIAFLSALGAQIIENYKANTITPFISYVVDSKNQDIKLYWRNEKGERFGSIMNLKNRLEEKHKKLIFAMNAGMYKPDHSAQGLFIENNKTMAALDTTSGVGNFYLKPNGIFYIKVNNSAFICTTQDFPGKEQIKFATQSGPMLVIDGNLHPAFRENSTNINIRNGVGILPNNRIIFIMSKKAVSFYEFANYFKNLGCRNALYLDGLVSRTYLPENNWIQTDGDFGVIIGVTAAGN